VNANVVDQQMRSKVGLNYEFTLTAKEKGPTIPICPFVRPPANFSYESKVAIGVVGR
jgi:hypothetical protein